MRKLYSALIIVVFIAVQLAVLPVSIVLAFTNPSITEAELLDQVMPYQAAAFAIGVIVVIIIGRLHKNKNRIERGPQSDIPVTIAWVVGGVVLAYGSQIVAGLVNVHVLGNPIESENTNSIIEMIESAPFMILVVALLGPILEEYVFRRAIFAEIYEMIPGARIIGFLVAGLISGLIFALAHWDLTHILIYVTMAYTFSFLYVMSGRLLVPILVHMLMNGLVVLLQVMFKDYIEQLEQIRDTAGTILRLMF
ncbi:CPBP family intramembrane glutamic endopeptidase [Salinicoccus hispanicus]|uniref:CPBP family intramembrane metalloprotease n=1 Tax=Salinicoccus hispanicus TaxID=157225 RepID=A0A6N8U4S1_9STAP|nr:CPBP family intramembrane glutamic endopeptidase [Salinicoccus hispanicus]MXQ52136.1 CPBP family intramembrane metalloprotease [Salinicoccus hispanicus]